MVIVYAELECVSIKWSIWFQMIHMAWNLKCIATISHIINIPGTILSIQNIINGTMVLTKPVSATEDMLHDSFHCYKVSGYFRAKVYIDLGMYYRNSFYF